MSVKNEILAMLEKMDDDIRWNDLLKQLYLQRKITIGLSEEELSKEQLTEADVNSILARLESTSDLPIDMRNTKHYHPSNAVTLGTVAGVTALLFSIAFMPVTWIAAPIALVAGLIGLRNNEDHAWLPIMLGLVSILPVFVLFS